ncbi:MAG: VOC family protein [Desulfosalsimonas sp.]
MDRADIVFDHVHLISKDPQAAASWYEEKLGGRIVNTSEVGGAPQIVVTFKGASLIIRGQREGEQASEKTGLYWGTDHFGFSVNGDFDGFCSDLKNNGVKFTLDPVDFRPGVRIAFIEAPDSVSIELLQRT